MSNRLHTIFILTILAMVHCNSIVAQESQSAFSYLRIPASAHAAALGGENISIIEDDASLALSNPSLLSSVSHGTVSLGYMKYMEGVSMYTAGYTHVVNDKATVGGAASYLNYGTMKEMTSTAQQLGTFNSSDLALEGIVSYTLAKDLVGGVGAKFLYSKLGSYTSTAAAIDLGLNYYHPDLDFSASFVVKNLGGQLSAYDEEFENLPVDVLLGATYMMPQMPFRLSLTFSDLNHWDYAFLRHASLGADVILSPEFYFAVGYNLRRNHEMKVNDANNAETSHGAGLTLGAGLQLEKFKLNVSYGKYHVSSTSLMFNAAFNI